MSLNIYLEGEEVTEECTCECCDNVHYRIYCPLVYDCNITHNLGLMADKAGIYNCLWRPDENNITHAKQLIQPIQDALKDMQKDPLKYKEFNPKNRWGSYDTFISSLESLLEKCIEYPEAKITVWR